MSIILALLQLTALTYHRARWPKVTPTQQQYGIVARQRTSIGFKLAVHGDSGAGGWLGSASTVYSILSR